MYDSLFSQTRVIRGMTAGPVGPLLGGYIAFLQQHRYSVDTIQHSLGTACVFSRWLEQEHIPLGEVSEEVLARYRDRFRRNRRKPLLPAEVTGLPKLLTWLREQGLKISGRPPSKAQFRVETQNDVSSETDTSQART